MEKSEIEIILDEEKNKAKKDAGLYNLLAEIGPFLAIANLPLSILVTSVAMITSTVTENKSLNNQPMPDIWLQKVSEVESVSDEGLNFLAKCIEEKGFVSVNEAIKFIEKENKEAKRKESLLSVNENSNTNMLSEGALNLMNKAKERKSSVFNKVQKSLNETIEIAKKINFLKK